MKRVTAALLAAAWLLAAPVYAATAVIDKVTTNEKVVALTIEDIEEAAELEAVLVLLREEGAKATFFVAGRLAGKLPLKKAAAQGHEVGNHGFGHNFWEATGQGEIARDLAAAAEAVKAATGVRPAVIRPPYGWYGDNFLGAAEGLPKPAFVVRGQDSGDWLADSPEAVVGQVMTAVRPGDIVNINMKAKAAAKALPGVIGELKRAGYKLVPVSELLGYEKPAKVSRPAGAPAVVSRVATDRAQVALTFDDGGSPWQVGRILEALRAARVRATFFLLGQWARDNAALVRQMAAEGHEIANHSYSHPYFSRLSEEEMRGEIAATQEVLAGITGVAPRLFRPPYGAYSRTVAGVVSDMGLRAVVLWDVDTRDWSGSAAETIAYRIRANVAPGSIVLLHLHGVNTPEALGYAIDELRADGYELTTVSGLLGE